MPEPALFLVEEVLVQGKPSDLYSRSCVTSVTQAPPSARDAGGGLGCIHGAR